MTPCDFFYIIMEQWHHMRSRGGSSVAQTGIRRPAARDLWTLNPAENTQAHTTVQKAPLEVAALLGWRSRQQERKGWRGWSITPLLRAFCSSATGISPSLWRWPPRSVPAPTSSPHPSTPTVSSLITSAFSSCVACHLSCARFFSLPSGWFEESFEPLTFDAHLPLWNWGRMLS